MDKRLNFLVDECLPISVQEFISGEYIHSTELLPHGALDNEVLEEAQKNNLILITADRKLALKIAMDNQKVIFQNQNGERFLLHGKFLGNHSNQPCIEFKTKYLLKNNLIVVP